NVGDYDTATELARANLALERELGNARGVALTLECLGQTLVARGDAAGARPLLTESLEISRELCDVLCEARAIHQLGLAAQLEGEPAEAYRQIAAALRRRHDVGDREEVATSLEDLGGLLAGVEPVLAA